MTKDSSSVDNIPGRYRCPRNGRNYSQVATVTLLHHLKQPWQWNLGDRHYYFCTDPDCDVVYFGNDDSVIEQSDLRTCVGLKDPSADALICYCFGVKLIRRSRPLYNSRPAGAAAPAGPAIRPGVAV